MYHTAKRTPKNISTINTTRTAKMTGKKTRVRTAKTDPFLFFGHGRKRDRRAHFFSPAANKGVAQTVVEGAASCALTPAHGALSSILAKKEVPPPYAPIKYNRVWSVVLTAVL